MNNQKIEKLSTRKDGILEVNSIFHTIQGEGPFCGTPAVFIRLAGCNLQCPQCDTEYTERLEMSIIGIVNQVVQYMDSGLVVITGGEPFRQKISPLIRILMNAGFYVQIESNGTLPPPMDIVWSNKLDIGLRSGAYIVCSPKAGRLNTSIEREACCFKYVVNADDIEDDGLPGLVLGHSAMPRVARPNSLSKKLIYIQPADRKNEVENNLNLQAAVKSSMENGYILQLQIHKLIGAE